MIGDDEGRTLSELLFAVEIEWWEFTRALEATPEGRRLLRLLLWLSRHPRVVRVLNWQARTARRIRRWRSG